ncbi:MAG: 5-deoxy-glucuronate isomerase [Sporichthyaceae bacterium]
MAHGGSDTSGWHLRAGSARAGAWTSEVVPGSRPGWEYTSLRIMELGLGGECGFATGDEEMLIVPLAGSARIECGRQVEFALRGRADVFCAVPDVAYLPRDSEVTVYAERGGRFALAGAPCTRRLEPAYVAASEIAVEVRGAGQATRQVNNLCMPGGLAADKLIVVEVLTPGGNWSSYPPHKHDTERAGCESCLEEIYYVELARPGLAYLQVYGTPERPIDVLAEVGHGDVVLVPHGWHGPAMAAPGVDLYYLNVMAGPGPERSWLICDDPAHAWVRDTWTGQAPDPRVPMTSAQGRLAR